MRFRKRLALASALALALTVIAWLVWHTASPAPIRLGILHSTSGAMAFAESGMVDGEMLAIEEINQAGGLLGRQIEPVVADGKSDWPTFAAEAARLITQEKVSSIVGCWTSASRKTVKPVIEQYNHLLLYPMAYEGLEQSPNIVYTGAAPNQQVLPALKWGIDTLGPKVFLVGSDYVWPHSVNAIIKDQLKLLGGELVGEEYIFFGSDHVDQAVAAIKASAPDVIFSSVAGDSNAPFYKALRAAGLDAKIRPVVSFSIGEKELAVFDTLDLDGHYVAYNYFQSLDNPVNRAFVERYRARYGKDEVTNDATEAGYFSVYLWAQAVRDAGSDDVNLIRQAIRMQSFEAPEGIVSVDPTTQHTWRPVSIGRMNADRSLKVVWSASRPIRPIPYPSSRTPAEWDAFLATMYAGWQNNWSNPVER